VASFLFLQLYWLVGAFQYTTERSERPRQNALFLCITSSYSRGWTLKRKYEIAGEYFEKSIDIFQETGAYSYLDQAENELGNLPQKTYA